jgi:hypothetical protein
MLINLRTDLKSLRYGNDTIGGGNSGQPYIQKAIPDSFNGLGASEDFLLRGGINAVTDSLTDVRRLAKMFTDTKSPNGLLFIAKQQLLSRTASPAQGGTLQSPRLLNEGVYNPLNTLAQAGVVAFGGHLNKQGINPFAETGAYAKNDRLYFTLVSSTNIAGSNTLKTVTTKNVNFIPTSTNFSGTGLATQFNISQNSPDNLINITSQNTLVGSFKNRLADLWYKKQYLNDDIVDILTYPGGPGSVLGVGKTNIRFAKGNGGQDIRTNQVLINTQLFPQNTNVLNFKQIVEQNPNNTTFSSPTVQDFRKQLRNPIPKTNQGNVTKAPNYKDKGIENRVNIGGQGGFGPGYFGNKNLSSYTAGSGIGPIDKINALPIYRSKNVETNSQDYPINDLVQFRIAVIDNNSPNFKTFIHFRAFIDSMSDTYNAAWSGFNYLGRSEQFYNYGGFTRNVSLSWTVAAQSKQELIPMYKKLNYLASSLTGDYSPNGYMRGNLVQLTVGGYLYEQPGIITSLTYDVPTESPWEIGINDEGEPDPSVNELPHIIRVTGFNFIPIQNFVPQKQQLTFTNNNNPGTTNNDTGFVKTEGFQRYIALANGNDKGEIFTNYDNPSTGSAT